MSTWLFRATRTIPLAGVGVVPAGAYLNVNLDGALALAVVPSTDPDWGQFCGELADGSIEVTLAPAPIEEFAAAVGCSVPAPQLPLRAASQVPRRGPRADYLRLVPADQGATRP